MEDIYETVINCLEAKEIKTHREVSVSADRAPSVRGAQKGSVTGDTGWKAAVVSLDLKSGITPTFPPECEEVMNLTV